MSNGYVKLDAVRVVLDTNVLLSACLKPEGLEARVVEMAMNGAVEAYVTPEVMEEYRDVLRRDKFRAVHQRAETVLAGMERAARRVVASEAADGALDEDDNRFLECAAASNAEFLITGNLRHYPAAWAAAQVVNARMFFTCTGLV